MARTLTTMLVALALCGGVAWWLLREEGAPTLRPAIERRSEDAQSPALAPVLVAGSAELRAETRAPLPLVRDPWAGDGPSEARRLCGLVVSAADERPLEGVQIEAIVVDPRTREPALGESVLSDDDGRFEFSAETISMQPYALRIHWHDDWAVRSEAAATAQPLNGTLRAAIYMLEWADTTDPPHDLRLRLESAWTIRGRTVDGAGRPLPGAHILGAEGSVVAAADGRFSISGASHPAHVVLILTQDEKVLGLRGWLPPFSSWARRDVKISQRGEVIELGDLEVPPPEAWDWERK